jgi:hypothetical protein
MQFPRDARLYELSSHTHGKGKRFTFSMPDGEDIYKSLLHNDPLQMQFVPAIEFDGNRSSRRLNYCHLSTTTASI